MKNFILIIGLLLVQILMPNILGLSATAKYIYDTEKDFYEWHSRYEILEKRPYSEKLSELRKLLDDENYVSDERRIDYEILFVQDLQKKGIKNKELIKEYATRAYYNNVSLSRFRVKDPTFNIFFETKIMGSQELTDFYDDLVAKDWILPETNTLSTEEKYRIYHYLSELFKWDDSYISNSVKMNRLKLARLYFMHSDFKKNYYCPNETNGDVLDCYQFSKKILGFENGNRPLQNKYTVKFLEERLKSSESNTDSLAYFAGSIYFDKEPSEKIKKAVDNGEYSEIYRSSDSTISRVEKNYNKRKSLYDMLSGCPTVTDEQKQNIMGYYEQLPIGYRKSVVQSTMMNPLIQDKGSHIINVMDKKIHQEELEELFFSIITFPFSFFKVLEGLP